LELCLDAAGGKVASQFASFCPREGVLLDICEQEWEGTVVLKYKTGKQFMFIMRKNHEFLLDSSEILYQV
jgi:hypothetical protein